VIAFNQRLGSGLSRDDLRRLDEMLTRLADNVASERAAPG
jgi:hypothetical protein